MSAQIYFAPATETAVIPNRATPGSAGWDLVADESVDIPPRSRAMISTGIHAAIPIGYFGKIESRSSLSHKKGFDVLAGVIDSDYRGIIKVIIYNTSDELQSIKATERFAQLIIHKISTEVSHVMTTEEFAQLTTQRGEGGFGSTNK